MGFAFHALFGNGVQKNLVSINSIQVRNDKVGLEVFKFEKQA
jgi:hypothetical protein